MMTTEEATLLDCRTPVLFHSLDCHGRLLEVGKPWLDLLGYRKEEVIGRALADFLSEPSRRDAGTLLPSDAGFCTDLPLQIQTRNGAVIDVLFSATAELDDGGEPARYRAVMTQVTQRKRAEKTLKDGKDIFLRAFRASGAILLISTLDTGRFVEVNEAFERILGYRRDEVIGQESSRFKIWQDPKDRIKYTRLLQDQGKVRDLEVRLRTKGREAIVALLSGELVELDGEKCLLSIINDITDRKRAAEELEVLHTNLAARALELEIANEELEAFSYTVSHDLRKPLTAVSGYCQVLLNLDCTSDQECQRFLREIFSGTVRMSELIDTLLEFSRLSHSELHKERVDLTSLAAEVVAELRRADPQRRVRVAIEEGLSGNGDPNLLRVVLDNLIGNAWKYSVQREEAFIELGRCDVDGKSAFFVRDNGVGFAASGVKSLFNAFHRQPGTEKFSGFGIGLATVKRIITRHGGRVWAEGETGQGATFYFTLG